MDDMIGTIIWLLISALIAYKCCENWEFKQTFIFYFVIDMIKAIIKNGFSYIFPMIIITAIMTLIDVAIYYKIYEYTFDSYLKFLLLSVVVSFLLAFALMAIVAMFAI